MMKLFRREPGFYAKLLALALPMLIQNLITYSLGLVDTFMVGALGEGPLAGVTLANIPVFVVQSVIFGVQSGSAVLISQYRGKCDFKSINRVFGIGMYAAGTITLAFALVMSFAPHWFMSLFGNDREIIATAARYARIVGWSYFFDSFVQVYIGAHRAMDNARRGMYILAVSMIGNTILNWVLIFGNLGAPRLEVEGAALATLLARILSFAIALVWAAADRQFRLDLALVLRPGREMAWRFIRVATPVVCNETLWGLGNSMFSIIMGHMEGSKEILAAYAIAGNIMNLCKVGEIAIGGTAAILIGHEIGSGRTSEARGLGRLLNALSFLVGLASGGIFLAVLHVFLVPCLYPVFSLSAKAADICTLMLTIAFATLCLHFFATNSITGVFRGGGDVRMAMLIDLLPLWLAAIPLAALAGLVLKAGILWVYLAVVSENLIKSVFCVLRFRTGSWIRDVTSADA